jgi:hypothetical protein
MEKIAVSKIVEFRRLGDGPRLTLINNLKKPKPLKKPNEEGSSEGGDYWSTSIWAISSAFKEDEPKLIKDKITDLLSRHGKATAKISKDMYLQNIQILHNVEDYNLKVFKPQFDLKYLSKPKEKSIFKINDVPIQVLPQYVYTFIEDDTAKVAAIWFIAKIKGYNLEEIGLFSDALYRYLKLHYSKDFEVSSHDCIAFDVSTLQEVRYTMLENNTVVSVLDSTVDILKPLL